MLKDAIKNLNLDQYLYPEEITLLNAFRGCIEPWVIVNLLCYMADNQLFINRELLRVGSVIRGKGFPSEENAEFAKRKKVSSVGYYVVASEQFQQLMNSKSWNDGLTEQRFFNYLHASHPFFSLHPSLQPYLYQQLRELQ